MKVDAAGADDIKGGFAGVVNGFTVGAVDSTKEEDFVFTIGVLD